MEITSHLFHALFRSWICTSRDSNQAYYGVAVCDLGQFQQSGRSVVCIEES